MTPIEIQDSYDYTKKALREVEERIKYCQGFLAEMKAGEYNDSLVHDPEFVTRNTTRMEAELTQAVNKSALLGVKIDQLEQMRVPAGSLPFQGVLRFFSGTGLDQARNALELLQLSIAADQWVPGASRRVTSILLYNGIGKASKKLVGKAKLAHAMALEPIRVLAQKWSSLRPRPTFTKLGASPTVTATLKDLGATAVDVCPMHYELGTVGVDSQGKPIEGYVAVLDWPEGTQHGTSRYRGTNDNDQCEACGHAIKNRYNWVPLLLTTSTGPKSLWVGRDCAKTLFGIDMDGDLEIKD